MNWGKYRSVSLMSLYQMQSELSGYVDHQIAWFRLLNDWIMDESQ
jgi:hypothetical protein